MMMTDMSLTKNTCGIFRYVCTTRWQLTFYHLAMLLFCLSYLPLTLGGVATDKYKLSHKHYGRYPPQHHELLPTRISFNRSGGQR